MGANGLHEGMVRFCFRLAVATLALGGSWSLRAHDAESLEKEALAAFQQGAFLRSGELFEKALELGEADASRAYNAACAYARGTALDDALRCLDRAVSLGYLNVEQLQSDSDLAALRQLPQWQEILRRCRDNATQSRRRWGGAALETPYRENISTDEKIAGLSRFWAEVKFNFANFDQVPELDWDSLYVHSLPRVRQSASTLEYYRLLLEMCAQLQDGHTNVSAPRELRDRVFAMPPVRTCLVENRVLIREVYDRRLLSQGVVPGLEIHDIDGIPVREYARDRVQPYQCASTPQDLEVRVYEYGLLRGAAGSTVALTCSGPTGERRRLALTRWDEATRRQGFPQSLDFRMTWLPGDIVRLELNSFGSQATADSFLAHFDEIAAAKAWIFDLRENGGGNSRVGYRILATLTGRPFRTSRWQTLNYRPAFRAWGRPLGTYGENWGQVSPDSTHQFAGPVVLLIGPRTYSAAEDFAVAFDVMQRGRILGEPSGGSSGQPLSFTLPGGVGARVCTKRDRYPDQREFVGVGVIPHEVIAPTVSDVREGVDPVLRAAQRLLQ